MSDKTYEAGTGVGSSLYPKSPSCYLVHSDDVLVKVDSSEESLTDFKKRFNNSGAYKYAFSIWKFKPRPDFESLKGTTHNLSFSSKSYLMKMIQVTSQNIVFYMGTRPNGYSVSAEAYSPSSGWRAEEYRTIVVHEEIEDLDFLKWLKENADLVNGIDLTNKITSVWEINEMPDLTNLPTTPIDVGFISGGQDFVGIKRDIWPANNEKSISFLKYGSTYTSPYNEGEGWIDEKYRTITFTELITDETLLAWLETNATLISNNTGGDIVGSGLPSYSTADNGKFLMIENGAPAWVLIEDGNKERY